MFERDLDLEERKTKMKPGTVRLNLAMTDEKQEYKIRDRLKKFGDFRVTSIPTTNEIVANEMVDADVLIVCNEVLARNRNLHVVKSGGNVPKICIFVALHRDQITGVSAHLERVDGCILLDGNLDLLPDVVRMARDGYCVFPDSIYDEFIDFQVEQALIGELSLIECAMLQEMGLGRDEPEIARRLGLYMATLDRLLPLLLKKLRITSPQEAHAFALRNRERLHQRRRSLMRENNAFAETVMH